MPQAIYRQMSAAVSPAVARDLDQVEPRVILRPAGRGGFILSLMDVVGRSRRLALAYSPWCICGGAPASYLATGEAQGRARRRPPDGGAG